MMKGAPGNRAPSSFMAHCVRFLTLSQPESSAAASPGDKNAAEPAQAFGAALFLN